MADRTFTLDIVTPERVVLHDEAEALVAPGVEGSFGVLANHAPFLSELAIGELRYRTPSQHEITYAVSGGFLQVFNNQVTVLADTAERTDEINVDRARAAVERAEAELRQAQELLDPDRRREAERALERARNRLRLARG